MTRRRLLTIPISHFCEKARWALERAGLPYREERHVQGVNRIVSRRAGGHGTLPVLVCEAGVLAESEAILRYADAHLPEARRLFPDQAPEVTALCRELDAGLGPDGRRLMYAHMLPRKDFMLEFNDVGVPRWEDRMMRTLWPVVARWGARELEVRDDTLEQDRPRVLAAFDGIAARLQDGRPYLFGERFTAADLTFAALAAAVVVPPEYGTPLPQPDVLPEPVARDVARFREHPAGAFALRLFRDHRRAAAA
jgi:glutathione S-transferase